MLRPIPTSRRTIRTRPAAGYVNVKLSAASAQSLFFLLFLVLGPVDHLVSAYGQQSHLPNISHLVIMPLLAGCIVAGCLCLKALELERAKKQIELQ